MPLDVGSWMELPPDDRAGYIKKLITFHEPILIIQKLRGASLPKYLLWELVHKSQEAKWGEGNSHSKSNFKYWLGQLEGLGIIEEHDEGICLTPKIGQWVANTANDKIEQREDFIRWAVCKKCTTPTRIVLFVPIMSTAKIRKGPYNSKISVDAHCPKCKGTSVIYMDGIWSEEEFRKFYDEAAEVLSASA